MAVVVYNLDWESCERIAALACYRAGILREDRKDFVQDVLVEMMGRARQDSGGLSTKELWRAARCVRNRYWRAYKRARRVLSLNAWVRDTEVELHETIADKKAPDLDASLDAKSRLESLPPGVVRIGKKLEKEDLLTEDQRLYLSRFRKGEVRQDKSMYRRYWERRALGMCVSCGERSGSFSHCPMCRERHQADQKKHREKKGTAWIKTMRDYWRGRGRCRRCGEALQGEPSLRVVTSVEPGRAPEPGRKTCAACLAKQREYLRHHRERRALKEKTRALNCLLGTPSPVAAIPV